MEYTEWETCCDANCLPSVLGHQSRQCSLGRLSAYYVDAKTPLHVNLTLAFVKLHNIRLTIRNTGHDYLGRNSSANSLALSTHNFQQMSLQSSF